MKKNTLYYQNSIKLSRRSLLSTLPAFLALPAITQAQQLPIKVRKLNSFELRVADVQRSKEFYQELFGMPEQGRHGERVCLGVGGGPAYMAIRPLKNNESPAITQLGYGLDNYNMTSQVAMLREWGFSEITAPDISIDGIKNAMKTWVRMRGDTPELYFADARGLIVQLSDINNCGGGGPLGNICKDVKDVAPGPISLTDISHFTAFVNDGAGANKFYQQLFDLSVQTYQGPGSPVTGVGDGYQFVMYAGPFPGRENAPANIHHGCFNMRDFDVDKVLNILSNLGLKARGENTLGPLMHYVSKRMPARGGAEGGTPELYFTDPDGILMQLQDASYCGGGGYLGNECIAE